MKLKLFWMLVVGLIVAQFGVRGVNAAYFTLDPSTGSTTVGNNLVVKVGIESGTDKVYAADIWMTFDASKFELVSVSQISNTTFAFNLGTPNIDNAAGTLNVSLSPLAASSLESKPVTGPVASLTFRAKASGVATVVFTCSANNVNDTNIINSVDTVSTDIVVCGSNQSGSYTIGAGDSGGNSGGSVAATPTAGASALPKTGTDGPTIALITMGLMSLFGAVYFVRL